MEAFDWVSEVFTIWAREVMWIKWGREVSSEEFDESAILFLFIGVVEHFEVVCGVIRSILGSPGLAGAA